MNTRPLLSSVLLAVSALLSACGGDSQIAGINGGGISNGGTSDPGVVVGPITGFGSIFVNGIEFDLNGSSVMVDGVSSTGQTYLRIGQIVTVKGKINQSTGMGTADSVEYGNNLKGVVSAVDTVNNTFTVIGQVVTVTGTTVFEGRTGLSDLSVSDIVEVSGFVNAAGKIVATRVERQNTPGNSELKGTVTNLNTVLQTFNIGTTTINYSGLAGSGAIPSNLDCVEVKGFYSGAQLNASSIEIKSCGVSATANEIGEIEGIITTSLTGSTFTMGTLTVSTANTPQYVNGTTADLLAGNEVEVEGTFNSSNVLVARKIEIKQGTDVRMTGLVESVNSAAKTLTMYGVTVSTNASTQFVNKLGSSNVPYALTNLNAGEFVEVRGYENASHTAMTAVTLEHRNADSNNRVEIRATASSVSTTSFLFTLLGHVNVDTTSVTTPPPGFFTTGNNDLVRVRGTWTSPTFFADSLEIETARP